MYICMHACVFGVCVSIICLRACASVYASVFIYLSIRRLVYLSTRILIGLSLWEPACDTVHLSRHKLPYKLVCLLV